MEATAAAATSGTSSIAPGETSLWSSILASTSRSSRASAAAPEEGDRDTVNSHEAALTRKRLVVLGRPSSGKTAIIQALRRSSRSGSSPSTSTSITANDRRDKGKGVLRDPTVDGLYGGHGASILPDLGLNYQYLDLLDEGEDDASLRMSIYTLPFASKEPYSALLPLALSTDNLSDNLVLITLDWERPWGFLEELKDWLESLRSLVDKVKREKGGEFTVQEGYDSVERQLRSYAEPVQRETTGTSFSFASSAAHDDKTPLPKGTLGVNLGLNVVVVCTKADHVTALTRNAHLTEEQAEYIQQTLRTICLQYGAALFFTSRLHPETFERLRAYILHRLYTTPTPFNPSTTQYANVPSTPTSSKTPAAVPLPQSTRHQYPFPYRANAVHRSTLLIPAGWDTWGKIRALRDDFSPETTLSGWMADIGMQAAEELEGNGTSLARVWRDYIVDVEASSLPPSSTHTKIEAQDEQDFLRLHYDILKREAAKPGATRGGPPGGGATTVRTKSPYATSDAGQNSVAQAAARLFGNSQPANGMPLAGVVGPMASTTLDMPTVERALDRESSAANPGESASNSNSAAGRGMARSRRDSARLGGLTSPGCTAGSSVSPPMPASPRVGGSATAGPSSGQNEVLANFFQSLLSARSTGSGTPSKAPSTPTQSAAGAAPTSPSRNQARRD